MGQRVPKSQMVSNEPGVVKEPDGLVGAAHVELARLSACENQYLQMLLGSTLVMTPFLWLSSHVVLGDQHLTNPPPPAPACAIRVCRC